MAWTSIRFNEPALREQQQGLYRYGQDPGRNIYAAPSGGVFRSQQEDVFRPALQQYADIWNNAANAARGIYPIQNASSVSPWAIAPSGITPQTVLGGQPMAPDDISVVSNAKNPKIKSILDRVLGSVEGMGYDLNQNPYMVRANVKDAGQAARIGDVATALPGIQQGQQKALADWTSKYLEGIKAATPWQEQEAAAIGEFYSKGPEGVQARLDKLAAQRQLAVAGAVNRALDRVRGQTNMSRIMLGDSSYTDAQAMQTAADIMAKEAIAQADLGRQNYLGVKDAQTSLADRRRQGLEALNRMGLLPIDAQTALSTSQLQNMGQLGNLINANTFYNVETPEDVMARRLGVLGQASNLDLANTFYGLRQPYEPDLSGYGYGPYSRRQPGMTPYPTMDFNEPYLNPWSESWAEPYAKRDEAMAAAYRNQARPSYIPSSLQGSSYAVNRMPMPWTGTQWDWSNPGYGTPYTNAGGYVNPPGPALGGEPYPADETEQVYNLLPWDFQYWERPGG